MRRAEGQRLIPEEYWYLRDSWKTERPLRKAGAETGKVEAGPRTIRPWKLGGRGRQFQSRGLVERAAEKS